MLTQIGSSQKIIDLDYLRNLNGQIRSVTSATGDLAYDGPRSWVYTYDELNRLTAANWTAGGLEDRLFAGACPRA